MQQCKSTYIEVRDEPDVKVMPMSATIDKVLAKPITLKVFTLLTCPFFQGSNIQLTCMTPNMPNIEIGFGWTKNRALLKLEPGSEVWEDLYPAGSILKITNTQVYESVTEELTWQQEGCSCRFEKFPINRNENLSTQ